MKNRSDSRSPSGLRNRGHAIPHAAADFSIEERIGRYIEPQPNGCWLFNGIADQYGRAWFTGRRLLVVHRFVYETLRQPLPDDIALHHRCETPGCCNPDHLIPVTSRQHGVQHRWSTKNPEGVARIHDLHAAGWSLRAIGADVGLSASYVSRIVRGLS